MKTVAPISMHFVFELREGDIGLQINENDNFIPRFSVKIFVLRVAEFEFSHRLIILTVT